MNTPLKTSLFANLALAAVVWFLAAHRQAGCPSSPPPPEVATVLQAQPHGLSPPQDDLAGRFEWRQLESSDYPSYVANLRAIKCPEQTVRDIVTADVAGLFDRKRKEMGGTGGNQETEHWSKFEEARLVARLLGDSMDRGGGVGDSVEAKSGMTKPARVPLVLQTQALAALNLTDEQQEEVHELTQQFIRDIGGLNQDPRDAAYFERWQRAQAKVDVQIVGAIGRRALVTLDQFTTPSETDDE